MDQQKVSLKDVRAVMRLIGECRELGADPEAWHAHLVRNMCRLVEAQVGIGANMLDFEKGKTPKGLSVYRTGWPTERSEALWNEYVGTVPVQRTPEYARLVGFTGTIVTRTRAQLYEDQLWYRSATYNEYHKQCGIDHYVFSILRRPNAHESKDVYNTLWVHRAVGERGFTRRDWWLMRTIHAQIGEMMGRELAAPGQPGPGALSPRQRDVLDALLDGDSEKQIAARLKLSQPTVHEHVTAVYRHFEVSSRGELMSKFIGRARPKHDA